MSIALAVAQCIISRVSTPTQAGALTTGLSCKKSHLSSSNKCFCLECLALLVDWNAEWIRGTSLDILVGPVFHAGRQLSASGHPVPASTFSVLLFYIWVLSGAHYSSMLASCCLCLIWLRWIILEFGPEDFWISNSSPEPFFSQEPGNWDHFTCWFYDARTQLLCISRVYIRCKAPLACLPTCLLNISQIDWPDDESLSAFAQETDFFRLSLTCYTYADCTVTVNSMAFVPTFLKETWGNN